MEFEENSIYLVLRGTDTKIGGIVKRYNFYSNKPSHVGIAIFENDQLKIFHVNENPSDRGDNLFYESLQGFISNEDLTYLSIWKIRNLDTMIYKRIYNNITESLNKKYVFDRKIEMNNDKYYCSEYVINMIGCLQCLKFKKNTRRINGITKQYLKRDTLIYYPVDGFIKDKNVIKIFEWKKID